MPIRVVVFGMLLSTTAASLFAQGTGDEQAIRQRFADLDTAWNHHDAQQITNPHTAVTDADFITVVGSWIKGREAFVATMTKLQAGPFHDVQRHTVVEKIRFVRPEVAVVITTNVDRHGDGPPSESRGTYVLSKEEGHWLLDSFQNTEVSAPPGPPPASLDSSRAQDITAIQARIDAEDVAIGRAIGTRDLAVLAKLWSPVMVVNSPANQIVGRDQVIESTFHGGLNYTSLKGTTEYFTVTNGVAIKMMHEDVVMADAPMAGKHVVRRATNILQRSGDDWLLIARQATYVGFDGAILQGPVSTTYTAPPATTETTAIRAVIEANNRAVGHAIVTSDFAALEKLWSPGMVVNSPGNNILTREQVFTAMREEKLNYTSSKSVPEAFFVSKDVAIEMGHDDIVMASGPMAGKPLTRRFTNVWQKSTNGWTQIARQATYVGMDGGAVYGHPDASPQL